MSVLDIVQSVLIVALFAWNVYIVNGANENFGHVAREIRKIKARLR